MTKFIKDTIHGEIEVNEHDNFIIDLLNTREMKRLRNIYQLGECHNVFFNAVHTRYMHSIGVYHNAKTFIDKLQLAEQILPAKDRQAILAAALLHDVGHGPRSHFFEVLTNFNHEKMTLKIIADPKTEVNQVLMAYAIKIDDVMAIIKKTHRHKFYYQIISSQIDADRLDYLLRDSHFTGANYGNIEPGILFHWASVIDDKIVFDYKAIGVIEDVLFSRWQMFKQIYTNSQVLCYEHILAKAFVRYKQLATQHFKFKDQHNLYVLLKPYIDETEWSIDDFILLDETAFRQILLSWYHEDDDVLHKWIDAYLNYHQYQCSGEHNFEAGHQIELETFNSHKIIIYNSKEPILINNNNSVHEITEYSPDFLAQNKDQAKQTKMFFYKKAN